MKVDLEDLSLCLAPLFPDPFSCTRAGLDEAVAAAADAGFRGVSYWSLHHALLLGDGATVDRECFAKHNVSVRVVEAATRWADGDRAAIDAEAGPLLDLACDLQAEHVLAVTMGPGPLDLDRAAAGLGYLCDRAAVRGLRVSVEFLPWSAVADLATAWALVGRADHPNLGLVLDTWHWVRQPGGPAPDVLATIPGERIHILQLCDAAAEPSGDVLAEAMSSRLLPGDGCVDFAALFDVLGEIGAEPVVAPEVFNPSLAAAGPAVFAAQIADATRAVLVDRGA